MRLTGMRQLVAASMLCVAIGPTLRGTAKHVRSGKPNCLKDAADFEMQRDVQIAGKPVPVRIAAGPRTVDRIIAHMVRFMLTNSLGLRDVQLFNKAYSCSEWMRALNWSLSDLNNDSTRPMLHVGLMKTEDCSQSANVVDLGEMGFRLRLGWFVRCPAGARGAHLKEDPDHWRYFAKANLAENFTLRGTQQVQVTASTEIRDHPGQRWCNATKFQKCNDNGYFTPAWCTGETACATLLAAFPHESYRILVEQIEELNLYVQVAWVGKRLDLLVDRLYRGNSNVLFFDLAENTLTYDNRSTEVLFRHCDAKSRPGSCGNQAVKVRKLVSKHLKDNVSPVYRLMEQLEITAETFNKLVVELSGLYLDDEPSLIEQACSQFLRWDDHKKWVDLVLYPKLAVLTVLPRSDSPIENATRRALNVINLKNLLPGIFLYQTVINGDCCRETVLEQYVQSVSGNSDRTIAVVAPECNGSLDHLIAIAKYYKHPVFSYSTDSMSVGSETNYSHFFRIPPSTSIMPAAYMHLFKDWGWSQFIFLYEERAASEPFRQRFFASMKYYGVQLSKSLSMTAVDDLLATLRSVKATNCRIIVAHLRERTAARVLCAAAKLQMTAKYDYVWLLPPWFSSNWHNKLNNLPAACTESDLAEAANYSIAYRFNEFANHTPATQPSEPDASIWEDDLFSESKCWPPNSGFAFDAIFTLATGLKNVENITLFIPFGKKDLARWIAAIRDNTVSGMTGNVSFVNSHRPVTQVSLYQYISGEYNYIGHYSRMTKQSTVAMCETTAWSTWGQTKSVPTEGKMTILEDRITWLNGVRPGDGIPKCQLKRVAKLFGVSCEAANTLFVLAMAMIGILIFTFVVRGVIRHQQQMDSPMPQRYPLFDGLSQYELPEDSVRIYRSLGEGAFGKVYLGEFLKAEGCVLPIAVKATKDPQNVNAKLELLSEAEVMKRFEHVNILRLIGVVTRNNKCQIVTEFMMYGNLRSFLQDRRHLAIKGEMNATHLTRMALDISRGLSYLASLNYVHGDLACRNCLVHETLVIKIADFGFCKNLVDQDYYRLVRSGVLPIRWMSPELLSTGVYHVQSDVWSFGIVLYEIVTFGSYPYFDLDDHEVQDYIRRGGFPALPQKVSSQLEALFLRIWALKKEDRPTAPELFETLAANPKLVHPSLEDRPSRPDYVSIGTHRRGSKRSASTQRVRFTVSQARVDITTSSPALQSGLANSEGV